MYRKTSIFGFAEMKDFLNKFTFAAVLLGAFIVPAFSQDDDMAEFSGKVLDTANRRIGKADFIQDGAIEVKIMFGYHLKMWLDGGKVRIIKPESGSRSTTINCHFREYKVDASNPNDSSRWKSTGSGTATLQMPPEGGVDKIKGSMTITNKVVGDKEVETNEKPQKFVIVIE